MLCQRPIAVIDGRLIAIGLFHRAFEVIGDKQLRHAAQEGQAAAVGVQPGHHVLTFTGLNVGVAGCPHHGHEDGHPAYFSGIRVDDGDRRATEVDKEFFAGAVLLAHREAARFFPLPVATAEVGVPHRQLTGLSLVLHPQ
ncbi:hypothetical protein D3C81_1518390 [compost metagenome]